MKSNYSEFKLKKSFRQKEGFTLIEILVAMVIVTIISALTVNMFVRLSRSYQFEKVVAETQNELRQTMERLVVEIRNAGFDPSRSDGFGVAATSDALLLRFTRDRYDTASNSYNGVVDPGADEQITFQIDTANSRLLRIADEGVAGVETQRVLLTGITNCSFEYLDEAGAAAASMDDTRVIRINLGLQNSAGWSGDVDRTLRTQVKLRNLGLI